MSMGERVCAKSTCSEGVEEWVATVAFQPRFRFKVRSCVSYTAFTRVSFIRYPVSAIPPSHFALTWFVLRSAEFLFLLCLQ